MSLRYQHRNVVDAETCIAGDEVGTCSYGLADVTPRGIHRVRLLLLASWTLLERRRSGVGHLDTAAAWMAWKGEFYSMSPRVTKWIAEKLYPAIVTSEAWPAAESPVKVTLASV